MDTEMREDSQAQEALEHLGAIRRVMESATRITVLPGRAAIVAGLLVLGACVASWRLMESFDFSSLGAIAAERRNAVIVLWPAVAALGVIIDIFFTVRLARKHGKTAWSRLGQLAAYSMGPCIIAALLLTVALAQQGLWGFLPAVWMLLYGAAVWMTGILSIRAPGILGAVFFVAGALTLFWAAQIGLIMIGLTFGIGHLVYGIYLLKRFGE